VSFTSDNGPKKGHSSAHPLRGHKRQPHECGVRAPWLACAPGRIPAGRTASEIATITDIYATFVRLASAALAPGQVRDCAISGTTSRRARTKQTSSPRS
jgi:arylsulfatase A-like enzyme